jgi:hypothetical protein
MGSGIPAGRRLLDVQGPGCWVYPSDKDGSATSLSLFRGRTGSAVIDHALAIGIDEAAATAGRFVFPAKPTDGADTSASAIPEATRFRLNPAINIASLDLPRLIEMIVRDDVRDAPGIVTSKAWAPAPGLCR